MLQRLTAQQACPCARAQSSFCKACAKYDDGEPHLQDCFGLAAGTQLRKFALRSLMRHVRLRLVRERDGAVVLRVFAAADRQMLLLHRCRKYSACVQHPAASLPPDRIDTRACPESRKQSRGMSSQHGTGMASRRDIAAHRLTCELTSLCSSATAVLVACSSEKADAAVLSSYLLILDACAPNAASASP